VTVTLPKLDHQIASGPGDVEIVGFPQILHTRAFGHPDMLFVPLLEGARDAANLCERLTAGGESSEHAATMSGIQLVSGLLKDSSFSLSARGLKEEHYYCVDLVAGTLSVHTRLYAEVSRRTSMIKVEIAGHFREGIYVVRSVGDSSVTLQFDEEQLKRPMFFSTALAEQCLRMQMQRDQTKRIGTPPGEEEIPEVQLTVSLANGKIPLILKQKNVNGEWEILEAQMRGRLGALSPDAENHLRLLFASLSKILAGRAGSTAPSAKETPQLVSAAKDTSGS
jgi:hypothetical protein